MQLNENRFGYWEGMPPRLRSRVYFFAIYYLVAAYFSAMGAWWGFVLLVLPTAWWVLKEWLLTQVIGLYETGEPGLLSYTFDYIWAANVYVRAFASVAMLAAVLGGLGWLGTEELRAERAKPTVTERIAGAAERVADKAADATEAAVETGKDWIATAKSWFD